MSSPSPAAIRENRLAHETSPYLLQHKHNPVDWWPWGPEALAEAKRAGKPVLLSVGYAACHWCHVMAHESFEDDYTASVMNELFVNIKVDREERPDIDQIYMAALHHLGQQGGWPLTMFLTSDGEPVWGGTYFPKDTQYGRPAFVDVLSEVARLFRSAPDRITHNKQALMERLSEKARPEGRVVIGDRELDSAAASLARAFDAINGGLRGAPKFPQCSMLELLWRAGDRRDPRFFEPVVVSLERMCEGGIYDHLGGGFARYSVDDHWLVPHFEKMLYDNAQLLELLALAHAHTGHALFRERARETVGWLAREMTRETVAWLTREMTTQEGAFCASLDADSEGEEGKFYVWSLGEIEDVLGNDDATLFAAHYDVTREGNFDSHNILNRLDALDRKLRAGDAAPARDEATEARLSALRGKLLAARAKRVRPGLDDKVLADWNGQMIAALVRAGSMLDEPDWIAMARRAFDFIACEMTRGDRLGHSWRAGRLLYPGLASDFAMMGRAALALHEATREGVYLDHALAWQHALDRHYANRETTGYYLTADDSEGLVIRPQSTADDANPNPNAVAAENLVRLAVLTGEGAWREKADRLIEGILPGATDTLFMHTSLLNAIDFRLRAKEIVVTGEGPQTDALLAAARRLPEPNRIVLHAPRADRLPPSHPAREKIAAAPGGAAFVCIGATCSLPVTEAEKLSEALRTVASS